MKNDKFHSFIVKLIPNDKNKLKNDIDLSRLAEFIHFDLIDIRIKKKVNDYCLYAKTISLITILEEMFINEIASKVKIYRLLIHEDRYDQLKLRIILHFNIGTLLVNYIIIKRGQKHEQKST